MDNDHPHYPNPLGVYQKVSVKCSEDFQLADFKKVS